MVLCGGHYPVIFSLINRLRDLAHAAALPMEWINPTGELYPKLQKRGDESQHWTIESSSLLHVNGGVALFGEASMLKKPADVEAVAEVLEHSSFNLGKGRALIDCSISIVFVHGGDLSALPSKLASSAALRHWDVVCDMNQLPEEAVDRETASHYLEDETFLDVMHAQPPRFSDPELAGILEQATRIQPAFGAKV